MKKLLFSFIIFFSAVKVLVSQTPIWQWVNAAWSPGNELAYDVAFDPVNNAAYTGGSFDGNLSTIYGPLVGTTFGLKDGLVAKYTAAGAQVWAFKVGGLLDDEVRSVAIDNNGDVYIAGTFNSVADFDPSPLIYNLTATGLLGQPDGFLAKYSASGNFLWAVKFGGNGAESVDRIFADAGNIYITGSYSNSAVFNSTSATTKSTTALQSGFNFYGAKYNSNGVVQWVVSGGGANNDEGYDVVADNNRVYFIGQYQNNFTAYNGSGSTATTLPVQTSGKSDAFILAYDQNGNLGWASNVSSSDDDSGNGITQDANSIYITGSIKATASFPYPGPAFTQNLIGGTDIYLASLSKTNGTFQWISSQTGSSGGEEMPYEITLYNNNSLVTAGYFKNTLNYAPYGGSNFTTFGNEDVFLSAHNLSGNYLWSKQAGAGGRDLPYGLSPGPDGVYTCGEYAGSAAFGPILLTNDAGKNLFVGKTGCQIITANSVSSSQSICPNTAPQVLSGSTPSGAVAPFSYYWEESSDNLNWTSAAGNNTLQNYAAPPLNSATWYRRTANAAQTCSPSLSNTVLVSLYAAPSQALAGSDFHVCSSSASLNASLPQSGSGKWTMIFGGGGIVSPLQTNSGVFNLAQGLNQFVWSVSTVSNCPSKSDTVSVTRDLNPTKSNAGADKSVCGTTANASANTPANGNAQWSIAFGGASVQTPGSQVTQFLNLSPGANVFVWTISSGVCPPSSDTVVFRSFLPPTNVSAGSDQFICNDKTSLNALADSNGKWSVISGNGIIGNTLDANAEINNISAGNNSFRWTVTNGPCPAVFDEVTVHRDLPPTPAFAGADQDLEKPETFLSASQVSVGYGSWSVSEGQGSVENPTDPKSRVTHLFPGDNILTWTVRNGVCPESSDDVLVHLRPLNIPNAFTPNSDGFNDAFVVPYLEYYDNVHFAVFNRWGGEVYSSNDYKNNWTGTNKNNEKLADDTYYYVMELAPKINFSGFVMIKQNK